MAPNEPVEVELKLLLPEHARAALERHPALQPPCATVPETREEHTVYFDTPLLSLAGKGLSLRVRRCGAARVHLLSWMAACLENFPEGDDIKYFDALQSFVNIVCQKVMRESFEFDRLVLNDIEIFTHCFKAGLKAIGDIR